MTFLVHKRSFCDFRKIDQEVKFSSTSFFFTHNPKKNLAKINSFSPNCDEGEINIIDFDFDEKVKHFVSFLCLSFNLNHHCL